MAVEWADLGTDQEVPGRDSGWGVEGDLAARGLEAVAELAAAEVPACGNQVGRGAGVARGQVELGAGQAEEDSAAVEEQEVPVELAGAVEWGGGGERELAAVAVELVDVEVEQAGAVELVGAGEQELAAVEWEVVEVGRAEEDSAPEAELAGAEELVEVGEQELVVVD